MTDITDLIAQPRLNRERRAALEQILFDDPDTMTEIEEQTAEGVGLVSWCRELGVRYSAIVSWINADPERLRRFEEAGKARADRAAFGVEAMARKILQPHIPTGHDWVDELPENADPKAMRVAMAGLQWMATTGNREKYGTRNVEHRHTHKLAEDHLAALRAAARTAGGPHGRILEAEATVVPMRSIEGPVPAQGDDIDYADFRVPLNDELMPAAHAKWWNFAAERARELRAAWRLPA